MNLYVVTEIVELLNSPVLYETRSENILGKFSFTWNMFVKVWDGDTKCIVNPASLPRGVWILISICFQLSERVGS